MSKYIKRYFYALSFFIFLSYPTLAQERLVSKPEVDSLKKKEEKLWYVDQPLPSAKVKPTKLPKIPTSLFKLSPSTLQVLGFILKAFIWAILAVAVLYAAYILYTNLKDFKYVRNATVKSVSKTIVEELGGQTLEEINFAEHVQKAVLSQNYRLAVRYYYLWLMQNLTQQNVIAFSFDKTNQDYIRDLNRQNTTTGSWLQGFKLCVRYYEYTWFGNFDISEQSFALIESTFKDFINQKR